MSELGSAFTERGVVPTDGGRPFGIHETALIGEPPEARNWRIGQRTMAPGIDPTALIGAYATIDAGTSGFTKVNARSWVMKHAHIGHDAYIGCDVEISTGAVIGGHAHVLDGARVGLNATVLPFKVIGTGAVVGAGAVVTKDVPDFEVWAGNPARPLADQSAAEANRARREESVRTAEKHAAEQARKLGDEQRVADLEAREPFKIKVERP